MSTRRSASGRRPERRAIASVRSGNGEIHTILPPGASACAAPSTKRSSMASRSPVRSTRRPRGGFVRSAWAPSSRGRRRDASRWRSSAPRAPAASRFLARHLRGREDRRSEPTSRRYGSPSRARSQLQARADERIPRQRRRRGPPRRARARPRSSGATPPARRPGGTRTAGLGRRGASSTRARPAPLVDDHVPRALGRIVHELRGLRLHGRRGAEHRRPALAAAGPVDAVADRALGEAAQDLPRLPQSSRSADRRGEVGALVEPRSGSGSANDSIVRAPNRTLEAAASAPPRPACRRTIAPSSRTSAPPGEPASSAASSSARIASSPRRQRTATRRGRSGARSAGDLGRLSARQGPPGQELGARARTPRCRRRRARPARRARRRRRPCRALRSARGGRRASARRAPPRRAPARRAIASGVRRVRLAERHRRHAARAAIVVAEAGEQVVARPLRDLGIDRPHGHQLADEPGERRARSAGAAPVARRARRAAPQRQRAAAPAPPARRGSPAVSSRPIRAAKWRRPGVKPGSERARWRSGSERGWGVIVACNSAFLSGSWRSQRAGISGDSCAALRARSTFATSAAFQQALSARGLRPSRFRPPGR